MKICHVLAFGSALIVAYACGGQSSLGEGSGGLNAGGSGATPGTDGGSYDPCAGKVCGSPCTLCGPNDPNCAEDAVMKYCDASGGCGLAYPQCPPAASCTTDTECPQIGAPCEQCPDGSYACPSMQCINGECIGSFQSCQGTTCNSDSDCPQVGAPCASCPDGTFACPWSACVNGTCAGGFDGCGGYEPCANKACGDPCSQCDPNDPTCAETAVLKYCDTTGTCSSSFPVCGGGGGTCTSDADCPGVGACPPCFGDGSCAENRCIQGACQLSCAPPANPECKTALDCPAIEICMPCPDHTCAQMDCVNGACQWVCR